MGGYDAYQEEIDTLRVQLLDAMLEDVPFDGWRLDALYHAAERLGLNREQADIAFPGGLPELAKAWSDRSDREMLARLDAMDLPSMRVRDRVAVAVRSRIEVNLDRQEAIRRLTGWLALPCNSAVGMANAARTVNQIWYAAGDTAADWNYYSKRGLLMPVYMTTVFYWLADDPDETGDYPATWAYLDRRIDDVIKTFGLPRKVKAWFDGFVVDVRPAGSGQRQT